MDRLQDTVVVIAGASSGIGRAAAHAFAREGARLVLAARREGALEEVAEDCRAAGADAIVVPTDITDPDAVRALADRAVASFGTIDVWIANAGTGAVGRFDETPVDAHRRTIEIDLLGHVYGAHAALSVFRRNGRGVFIANVSIGAWTPTPFAASYAAAKAGLNGLLESLRAELVEEPGIAVCGVYPSFVDSPGLSHGANYTGRELDAGSPFMHDPEEVAAVMVDVALTPRPRAIVGVETRLARLGHAIAPGLMESIAGRSFHRHFRNAPPGSTTDGNLFRPVEAGQGVHGGFKTPLPGWIAPAMVAGLTVAAAAAWAGMVRGGSRR